MVFIGTKCSCMISGELPQFIWGGIRVNRSKNKKCLQCRYNIYHMYFDYFEMFAIEKIIITYNYKSQKHSISTMVPCTAVVDSEYVCFQPVPLLHVSCYCTVSMH